MTLTLAQARTLVETTLGGSPESATVSMIINAAGNALYSMHEWEWLLRPTADLGTTADQAYIDLPSDFGRLEAVLASSRLEVTSIVQPREMISWRRGDHYTPRGYVIAISTANSSGSLQKRLELYPTPSQTDADALQIAYYAAWPAIDDATNGSTVLPIEPSCELIFLDVLSAVAKGIEEDDNGYASQRITAIKNTDAFRDAVAHDVNVNPIVGHVPNGGRPYHGTSHITLLDPTDP